MSTLEPEYDWNPAERLFLTLSRAHSPLAAALMATAVTGYWPETASRAIDTRVIAPVTELAVTRAGRRRAWS
ncbi:hypothetical protein AB0L82_23515 [Nocardia sp. NPDC052001]|uniref:hypothetical protein n=1 Tax=unclassified Nocardia TaxID=2637762 RepID=UPI00343FE731